MSGKAAVIGGGSWGTSLACLLADKGYAVSQWVFEKELIPAINTTHENPLYMKGFKLPPQIRATNSPAEAVADAEFILFVVPSQFARAVLTRIAPEIKGNTPIISATKGIETDTLLFMSEVMAEVLPASDPTQILVLSGPSFAKEVCQRQPTAVSLGSKNHALAVELQKKLITSYFKVFTTTDVIGLQLGGALKNVIAIAVGGADGLGFGFNTRAALISRGLAEINRLGKALGADPETCAGLSGLGDLVLTSTGSLSRNRAVGYQLGLGKNLDDILKETNMVAEGVETTRAAYHLARKHGVRMPIVSEVFSVLFHGKDPREAVNDLMERTAGDETS